MTPWLRITAFRLSLLVTLGMALLYVAIGQTGLAHNLETKTLDLRFRWRGVHAPGSQVVIVAIDDASITELGRWPWSRHRFAELVRRLKDAGARVIAFDLLFTESEESPLHDALRTVKAAFEALPRPIHEADAAAFHQSLENLAQTAAPDDDFARALQEAGNVVLAHAFKLTETVRGDVSSSLAPPRFSRAYGISDVAERHP